MPKLNETQTLLLAHAVIVNARLARSGRVLRLVHDGAVADGRAALSLTELLVQAHRWWAQLRMGEQRLLTEYWKAATIEPRHPSTSCHLPYRWIAQRLIDHGAEIDEANRP